MKQLLKPIVICLASSNMVLFTACSKKNDTDVPQMTQVNELLKMHKSICKQSVINVSGDLITDKKHLLQLLDLNIDSIANEDTDIPVNITTFDKDSINISGTLRYNDRPTFLRIDAVANTDKSACHVSYQLNYQLDVPCMEAREEAFKKWKQIAVINDETRYYQHMRKSYQKAYLTNMNRNLECLVNVRASQLFLAK